ncbi:MAG: recombination-associated protein RdgC [Pseudomonadota bacterium]
MWFKNLVVYRLPADWDLSPCDLEERLQRRRLQPCGPLEMLSRGWVAPAAGERLVHTVGLQQLFALGVDQRLLPASVIRQEVTERADLLEQEQGFPVGRRQLRELKLRVADEMRPRAFVRRRVTRAWLDPAGRWFCVEAAGAPRAEELVEMLRETLGTFPITPVDTEHAPHLAMAAWLRAGDAPLRFTIDQDLELQGAAPSKALVRYARHPLDGKPVQQHLQDGLQPTRLGLTWNDRVSFVLTTKLQVKRIDFLEVQDEAADGGETDAQGQFDADFAMMAGELAALLADLVVALGGKSAREQAAAA